MCGGVCEMVCVRCCVYAWCVCIVVYARWNVCAVVCLRWCVRGGVCVCGGVCMRWCVCGSVCACGSGVGAVVCVYGGVGRWCWSSGILVTPSNANFMQN